MTTAPGPAGAQARPPESFGALRHRGFRAYFVTYALAMTADNVVVALAALTPSAARARGGGSAAPQG